MCFVLGQTLIAVLGDYQFNSVCVSMTTTPSTSNDMKVKVTRSRSKVKKTVFWGGGTPMRFLINHKTFDID